MVSRRNFLAITLIMFLVLFMFQFSEFMKNFYNDYGTNPYADSDTVLTLNTAIQTNDGAQAVAYGNDYAVVIGSGSASSDTVCPFADDFSKRVYPHDQTGFKRDIERR